MNTVQIYDINTNNDDLQQLIDKLKSVGAQICRYNVLLETDELSKNIKVKRLYDAYGKDIFPVTMVNGEIVKVEENLKPEQIIAQTEISMKKIIQAGIEINSNLYNTNKKCGGCGCSKSNCASCDSKKHCNRN